MKTTDLQAYKEMMSKFESKEFTLGVPSDLPIYSYDRSHEYQEITPGHYVSAISYGEISFSMVPNCCKTRDFFLKALSSCHKDVLNHVKKNLRKKFDRQFFKDHIASEYYALSFDENCFEYMPLEYIDEEMVACAMYYAIKNRPCDRRNDHRDWFYSVARRKKSVIPEYCWVLAARLYASKRDGYNDILKLTPEKYRTEEYYFEMCMDNDTKIMEDVPEEILTDEFLAKLLMDNTENIKCFTKEALERKVKIKGKTEIFTFWQVAIVLNGLVAKYIPLNQEVVDYFLAHYDKDSFEYECGFKYEYKEWLRKQKNERIPENSAVETAKLALGGILVGIPADESIQLANDLSKAVTRNSMVLPISFQGRVPEEYSKKYDKEEYLLEIYKKLKIEVCENYDCYYYSVKIPETFTKEGENGFYTLKDGEGNIVLEYVDLGPFYDKDVYVSKIYVSL